jgi:hypothetical protein
MFSVSQGLRVDGMVRDIGQWHGRSGPLGREGDREDYDLRENHPPRK